MGDVVTALGRAVQEEGHRVEVILPKYDCIRYDDVSFPFSFQCLMPHLQCFFASIPCEFRVEDLGLGLVLQAGWSALCTVACHCILHIRTCL